MTERGHADGDGVAWFEIGAGTPVALHLLGDGRHGRPTLIAHANGFHGRCYRALSTQLGAGHSCVGIDLRGHGLTGLTAVERAQAEAGGPLDWRPLGRDVGALARRWAPEGGLLGVGHSMGGATLLMAAHRDPVAFDRLVLFEPIAPPTDATDLEPDELPIVRAAVRRRAEFASVEAAIENYRSKPPMSLMRDDVLRDYVVGGTRPVAGGVALRCTPAVEAAFFRGTHTNGVCELLGEIEVPTLVVSGRIEPGAVAEWSEGIAARLPNGEYRLEDDLTHFGPFSRPDLLAAIIDGWRPARRS